MKWPNLMIATIPAGLWLKVNCMWFVSKLQESSAKMGKKQGNLKDNVCDRTQGRNDKDGVFELISPLLAGRAHQYNLITEQEAQY